MKGSGRGLNTCDPQMLMNVIEAICIKLPMQEVRELLSRSFVSLIRDDMNWKRFDALRFRACTILLEWDGPSKDLMMNVSLQSRYLLCTKRMTRSLLPY